MTAIHYESSSGLRFTPTVEAGLVYDAEEPCFKLVTTSAALWTSTINWREQRVALGVDMLVCQTYRAKDLCEILRGSERQFWSEGL